jgi:hypothetical protein
MPGEPFISAQTDGSSEAARDTHPGRSLRQPDIGSERPAAEHGVRRRPRAIRRTGKKRAKDLSATEEKGLPMVPGPGGADERDLSARAPAPYRSYAASEAEFEPFIPGGIMACGKTEASSRLRVARRMPRRKRVQAFSPRPMK